MIVDVVFYRMAEDMPIDEVNESIVWVIEQQWEDPKYSAESMGQRLPPKVYLNYPEYPHEIVDRGGNQGVSWKTADWTAIVVSDERLTEEQATEKVKEAITRAEQTERDKSLEMELARIKRDMDRLREEENGR